jgi:hypothetical protein
VPVAHALGRTNGRLDSQSISRAPEHGVIIDDMLAIRPGTDEYGAFYAGYIARVRDGDWLARLQQQPDEYRALLGGLDEARAAAPSAPGKWSIVEILGHVCDTERVFGFRLLWFARGAPTELPGFDQDAWVEAMRRQPRTLASALDEFAATRQATLSMLRTVADEDADRRGVANGHPVTVRACGWMIAGHAQHHLDGLRQLGI